MKCICSIFLPWIHISLGSASWNVDDIEWISGQTALSNRALLIISAWWIRCLNRIKLDRNWSFILSISACWIELHQKDMLNRIKLDRNIFYFVAFFIRFVSHLESFLTCRSTEVVDYITDDTCFWWKRIEIMNMYIYLYIYIYHQEMSLVSKLSRPGPIWYWKVNDYVSTRNRSWLFCWYLSWGIFFGIFFGRYLMGKSPWELNPKLTLLFFMVMHYSKAISKISWIETVSLRWPSKNGLKLYLKLACI